MKAVVYHADSHFAWGGEVGETYRKIFEGFKKNCHDFGYSVVHLTLEGFPGYGDENIYFSGYNPREVMFNRELIFCEYLENADDGVHWFTEPDYRIYRPWPPLKADCALLYRPDDAVKLNPAWRLATRKAAPLFREFRDAVKTVEIRPGVGRDWHCDSDAFNRVFKRMGTPERYCEFVGVKIELRDYYDYIKGRCTYGRNYLSKQKEELLRLEWGSAIG